MSKRPANVSQADVTRALRGERLGKKRGSAAGSPRWLWVRYCNSSALSSLSLAMRRQRENIMAHVLAGAADASLGGVKKKLIVDRHERRKDTPSQANNFLKLTRHIRLGCEGRARPILGMKDIHSWRTAQ